ncbi:CD63 antigen-like [Pectinophora gossypiella]|uniref:Tetraspanin n=1 Tax=Pectinophora gossypiella TaxID=13191 RepID=A0A1E1W056_PECGO|nr:CD63 antigen-like [Pectinophora gossypiella]
MENNFQSRQKMNFSKSEAEYNLKSIRFLLLTITTMFIIIAGLMIVLGISVYSHYHSFNYFYESAKSGRFFTPSVLSVLLGLGLLVVTSFGFFGTLKQSTCLVNMYALILSVLLIFKLVVVILAFTTDADLIMKYINIPIRSYGDPEIQDEIDRLQVSLNCCGSTSLIDYRDMEFTANQSTVVTTRDIDGELVTITLPASCCITPGEHLCGRVRTTGCRDALVNLIVQNASVLGVLGVSVMFIQILGITFALLLARCIRKMKSEKALQHWKVKEQMILARQADGKGNSVYISKPDSSVA